MLETNFLTRVWGLPEWRGGGAFRLFSLHSKQTLDTHTQTHIPGRAPSIKRRHRQAGSFHVYLPAAPRIRWFVFANTETDTCVCMELSVPLERWRVLKGSTSYRLPDHVSAASLPKHVGARCCVKFAPWPFLATVCLMWLRAAASASGLTEATSPTEKARRITMLSVDEQQQARKPTQDLNFPQHSNPTATKVTKVCCRLLRVESFS